MRGLIVELELDGAVEVESAGTGNWHVGDPPDPRSVAAARERGVELAGEARQVGPEDFERFDLLVAMDRSNRDDLLRLAPDESARAKVRLLRELGEGLDEDVPDPYYGGEDGFADVVAIVERNCRALAGQLR
jgi:protein-tyrosine phosphatase